MFCPLKFNDNTLNKTCCLKDCAWYDEYYGKCAIAIEGYLKGLADLRAKKAGKMVAEDKEVSLDRLFY